MDSVSTFRDGLSFLIKRYVGYTRCHLHERVDGEAKIVVNL